MLVCKNVLRYSMLGVWLAFLSLTYSCGDSGSDSSSSKAAVLEVATDPKEASVDIGAEYTLPTKATITRADGTSEEETVTWTGSVDTSAAGIFTFSGKTASGEAAQFVLKVGISGDTTLRIVSSFAGEWEDGVYTEKVKMVELSDGVWGYYYTVPTGFTAHSSVATKASAAGITDTVNAYIRFQTGDLPGATDGQDDFGLASSSVVTLDSETTSDVIASTVEGTAKEAFVNLVADTVVLFKLDTTNKKLSVHTVPAVELQSSFTGWSPDHTISEVVKMTHIGDGKWVYYLSVPSNYSGPAWVASNATSNGISGTPNGQFKFRTGTDWGSNDGLPDYGGAAEAAVGTSGEAVDVIASVIGGGDEGGAKDLFTTFESSKTYMITLDTVAKNVKIAKDYKVQMQGSFAGWSPDHQITTGDGYFTQIGETMWEYIVVVPSSYAFPEWVTNNATSNSITDTVNAQFKLRTGLDWGASDGLPDYGGVTAAFVKPDGTATDVLASIIGGGDEGGAKDLFTNFEAGKSYKFILDTANKTLKIVPKKMASSLVLAESW